MSNVEIRITSSPIFPHRVSLRALVLKSSPYCIQNITMPWGSSVTYFLPLSLKCSSEIILSMLYGLPCPCRYLLPRFLPVTIWFLSFWNPSFHSWTLLNGSYSQMSEICVKLSDCTNTTHVCCTTGSENSSNRLMHTASTFKIKLIIIILLLFI